MIGLTRSNYRRSMLRQALTVVLVWSTTLGTSSAFQDRWDTERYSERLRALLGEANKQSSLRIQIERLPPTQALRFQGETEFAEDKIIVRVASGYSLDHEEQILAHELFHTILFNDGFTTTYTFDKALAPTHGGLMNTLVRTLNACPVDVLIDERMEQQGFNPELQLKRTKTIMQGGDCCDFRYSRKDQD